MYPREFEVLEAVLTAIDLIAQCESGCQPPRVDRGMGTRCNLKGLLKAEINPPKRAKVSLQSDTYRSKAILSRLEKHISAESSS